MTKASRELASDFAQFQANPSSLSVKKIDTLESRFLSKYSNYNTIAAYSFGALITGVSAELWSGVHNFPLSVSEANGLTIIAELGLIAFAVSLAKRESVSVKLESVRNFRRQDYGRLREGLAS